MAEKKFKETKKAHKKMLKTQTKVIKDFGFQNSGKTRIGSLANLKSFRPE